VPLTQNNNSLTYFDGRFVQSEGGVREANLGLGKRWMVDDQAWLVGIYGSYDLRRSESHRDYRQLTAGFEALSQNYDVNANYYYPTTDKKLIGSATSGGFFAGNSLYANGVYEEALEGYDFEVGRRLPMGENLERFEPRIYVKYFDFGGDVLREDNDGVALRLTARPQQNLTLELSWEDDDMMGDKTSFSLSYSFGYSSVTASRSLRQRMTEFHQRDIDIRETSQLSDRLRTSTSAGDRVLISDQVVHVDNTNSAGGDGSFENPYSSLNNCSASSCVSSEVIYLHAGAANYTTPIALNNGQKLIGQGASFYGLGGDAYPVLEAATDLVVLANDNEVAGISLRATAGNALVGVDNQGDISIHNNQLWSRGGDAIKLSIDTGASIERSLIISGNSIDSDQVGIDIDSIVDNGGQLTQSLIIANNSIVSTYNGVDIDTNAMTGAKTVESINITNNHIQATASGARGMSLDLSADDAGTLSERSTLVSGNQLTVLDGYGFEYYGVEAENGGHIIDSFSFTGNQITSKEHALYLNHTDADGAGTQIERTVYIADNTLKSTDTYARGIRFYQADSRNGGDLALDVQIINNDITSKSEGIEFFNQDVEQASTYNLTIDISDNTINSEDHGIAFYNYKSLQGSTFNGDVNIRNNNITAIGSGVYLEETIADGAGSSLTRNWLVEDNSIQATTTAIDIAAPQATDQGRVEGDLIIRNN